MDSLIPTDISTLPATVLLALLGVGVAEFVGQLFDALPDRAKKFKSPIKILVCSLTVALAALTVDGITALQGAVIGFAAAGALTGLSFLGKKSGDKEVVVQDGPGIA